MTTPLLLTDGKYQPNVCCASHLTRILPTDELKETIKHIVFVLRKYSFDAIAFRGMSGALLAPPVALALNKSMIMVRKPIKGDDRTHSCFDVEGDIAARTYIILDDFVSTGRTVRKIVEAVKFINPDAICIGVMEATQGTTELTPLKDVYRANDDPCRIKYNNNNFNAWLRNVNQNGDSF